MSVSSSSEVSKVSKSTTKSGWKSSAQQELEQVNQLLKDYEKANLDLKDEILRLNEIQAIHIKRLQDMDKTQKQLLKKIRSLETTLKFEKVAGEGLRKRGNTFEASVTEFQEKANHAGQQLQYYLGKNEELEATLQHERSTRLQLLHEKTKLFQELGESKRQQIKQETELVSCHQKITDYIQKIETLSEQVRRQEELLKFQSKDFVAVSHEIIHVKEQLLQAKEQLLSEYQEKHNFHFSVDLLQKEISYLRKELVSQANTHTERSYSSFHRSHPEQYAITDKVNRYTAGRYETSNFTENQTFTSKQEQRQQQASRLQIANHAHEPSLMLLQSVVTPLNQESSQLFPPSTASTDHSFRSKSESRLSTAHLSSADPDRNAVSRLSTADRPRGALDYLEVTNKDSRNFNNQERMEMLKWIRNSGKELSQLKNKEKVKAEEELRSPFIKASLNSIQKNYGNDQSSSLGKNSNHRNSDEEEEIIGEDSSSFITRRELERKSLFVGSGLNFRHDDVTDRKLKELQSGSTKQILKKILEAID